MAGQDQDKKRPLWDFLFYDKKLPDKPEVLHIAAAVNEEMIGHDRFWVAGCLMNFWGWVDDQFPDGFLRSVSVRNLFAIRSYLTEAFVRGMCEAGWLVVEDGGIRIPNSDRWLGATAKRRFQDRQRMWNNRHNLTESANGERTETEQKPNRNRTCSPQDTDSELDSDSSKDTEEMRSLALAEAQRASPEQPQTVSPAEFASSWNSQSGLQRVAKMTQKRKVLLAARCKEAEWVACWRELIVRVGRSSFCCGGGDRGWKAGVDWFLNASTYPKIMEGQYDDRTKQASPTRAGVRYVPGRDDQGQDAILPEDAGTDRGNECGGGEAGDGGGSSIETGGG